MKSMIIVSLPDFLSPSLTQSYPARLVQTQPNEKYLLLCFPERNAFEKTLIFIEKECGGSGKRKLGVAI